MTKSAHTRFVHRPLGTCRDGRCALTAWWEDTKFGLRHTRDFDKIAVVGGPTWVAWGMKLMNHLTLWAYIYAQTDKSKTELSKDLRTLIDRIGVSELAALVRQRRPDAVIWTHFLPLNLLAWEKRKQRLTVPLYCVVTDYTGHIYWVEPDVDRYFVATPETSQILAQRGVGVARIRVTGIPVDPAIATPKNPVQMRQRHHLDWAPVVTLMGGGLAVERVEHIIHGLMRRGFTGTLLVVAGRNTKLKAGLQHVRSGPTLDMRVLGFVDYLDDLVAASDLVITKAGGLMVSEIMARQTPMLLIDPIPGQEEWNADYVVSVGAGVQLRLLDMGPMAVDHLLRCPARLAELRAGAARAGQPHAALKVAEVVLTDHHIAKCPLADVPLC